MFEQTLSQGIIKILCFPMLELGVYFFTILATTWLLETEATCCPLPPPKQYLSNFFQITQCVLKLEFGTVLFYTTFCILCNCSHNTVKYNT